MTPTGEARLRAYADAVAAAGHPPPSVAQGLADEMLAHLVEAARERIAAGTDEDAAIDAAIEAFGPRATIGAELARTYPSRRWAAPVGTLLIPRADDGAQPGSIGALRLLVAIASLMTVLAGIAGVLDLTPAFAAAVAIVAGWSVVGSILVYRGLGLGRRWALLAAAVLASVIVYSGIQQVSDAPEGTTIIPVLGIFAAACLLWLWGDADRVSAYVAGSPPIGRLLGSTLVLALVAPGFLLAALPAIRDPTQASAADVAMTAGMTCGTGPGPATGDPAVDSQPTATLTVDLEWSRTDLAPEGLVGLVNGSDLDDTAGFRVLEPEPFVLEDGGALPRWLADLKAPAIDTTTGETIGWFGASSPSVERIPATIGSFTVGIDNGRIRAGHPIRIVWALTPSLDGPQTWPRAEVAYAHLDRFVMIGTVGCGE